MQNQSIVLSCCLVYTQASEFRSACQPQMAAAAEEWLARGRGGRRQRTLRRWHARLISAGVEAGYTEPHDMLMPLSCLTAEKLAAVQQMLEKRADWFEEGLFERFRWC